MREFLFKKNYLAMIENSVKGENWMFRNFYIRENGFEKDVLESGSLSCAVFVSSILYLQNSLLEFLKKPSWIKFTHANVGSIEKDMHENGWLEITELKQGAIIIWERQDHEHVGFCVSETEAISNDSNGTGFPWRHHITYENTRPIKKILWHSELDNG